MNARSEHLLDLATSIADGQSIRLDEEVAPVAAVDPELIRELRVIAALHHTLARDVAEASPPNRLQWGRLAIEGELGSGAFCEVYRAWDPDLRRHVALKVFRTRGAGCASESLLHEGRLLARVRHPNIVTVYDVEQRDGEVGLWLELIDGRTLTHEVTTTGPLGFREAALIGQDLCRALAAVHRAGLVHRDVKPQNVMRERGGRIVLMDFGIGWELGKTPDVTDIGGTPLYMAPELFGGAPATISSDIYSLGVLLFYLVTGSHPVTAATRAELEHAHTVRRHQLLQDARSDAPAAFVQAIERACAARPEERHESAGAMERALAAVLGVSTAPPPRAAGATRAWSNRGRLLVWMAATALVAVAGGLFMWHQMDAGARWANAAAGGVQRSAAGPTAGSATSDVAARPSGEYTVRASFDRAGPGGASRLAAGDRVRPGDRLFLEVEASTSVHVYVVNQDEHGESYLLFPLPGQTVANPLKPHLIHRLPAGSDDDLYWQVTSVGGREHFLVVATPEPLVLLERVLATLPRPQIGHPVTTAAPLPREAIGQLRGIGGLAHPSHGTAPLDLLNSVTMLKPDAESVSGPWMRQFTLENSGR
ncbi:MAG TPA: serine/threonine-protein kinase [Vicinamibacterales bacterium]|nr:serine/threonine-protein kinase [Vicinamibacterales bacterium]